MKVPALLLFIFSFLVACHKERPTQEEIAEYICSDSLVFTESYLLSKNLIQDYKDQEGQLSKALIPVQATLSASVDLSKIRSITIDSSGHTVHIALPVPVLRIELPKAKTLHAMYCSDVSRSIFFEPDVQSCYAEALPLFRQFAVKSGISERVQQEAAFAVATLMQKPKFKNMDYKIEIIKYSEQDLLDFILQ